MLLLVLFALLHRSVCVNNEQQEEGPDLTVKIYEQMPKHLCGRALANLEVIIYSLDKMGTEIAGASFKVFHS